MQRLGNETQQNTNTSTDHHKKYKMIPREEKNHMNRYQSRWKFVLDFSLNQVIRSQSSKKQKKEKKIMETRKVKSKTKANDESNQKQKFHQVNTKIPFP